MEHGRIRVHLIPRAQADEIAGERAGALLVRVTAPPADGRANAALCSLLAARLGVAPSRVSILHGQTSRQKLVGVQGMDSKALARALGRHRS